MGVRNLDPIAVQWAARPQMRAHVAPLFPAHSYPAGVEGLLAGRLVFASRWSLAIIGYRQVVSLRFDVQQTR